jgi:RNA polymerase sigma-70 factor (ECF subfamily)
VTTDLSHLRVIHDLVAAAQAGDTHAMEDLISTLRPVVYRYCRSRLITYPGGLDAADDVAQETCMAVYRIVPRYQDTGRPFTALVFAIASNKIADAQRGFSRSAVLVDEIPDQTEPSPGPEERAMTSVNFREANQLINRLPCKMREVLVLRATGVSAENVAERLGMSAGTVRVTHHRAVAKLRKLVDESDEHQDLFRRGHLAAAS